MKNLLFLLLILITVSCNKADLTVDVKAEVFQCCNIWDDFLTPDNTHATAVNDFLNEQNITATNIETIEMGLTYICATCCLCPDDKEVRFKVSEEDLEAVLALGFEEN